MQSVQHIAVINGRPTIWGDAALALVMAHPEYDGHDEHIESEGPRESWIASCTMKRKGRAPVTQVWTWQDAINAKLASKQGPWTEYPKRMLKMRARSWAIRDQFPDALKGIGIREEVSDTRVEKDITPAKPAGSRLEDFSKLVADQVAPQELPQKDADALAAEVDRVQSRMDGSPPDDTAEAEPPGPTIEQMCYRMGRCGTEQELEAIGLELNAWPDEQDKADARIVYRREMNRLQSVVPNPEQH